MKKLMMFWLALGCSATSVLAQNLKLYKVTGTVKYGETFIQAASVALLNASDSVVVKMEMTDENGKFNVNAPAAGRYILLVSSVGYNNQYSPVFTIGGSGDSYSAGVISLNVQSKDLTAVVVTAKKPLIEQKIDKLVVNVDAAPSNAGATAMEVIEKLPGISVNNEGAISLKGKPGVVVMLDGKPTYLSREDLANLLKNTPASAIDKIEIMTNPSSKYDAAGNSGIINIKTKKNLKLGLNGSVMVGASAGFFSGNDLLYVLPKSQNSLNFNFRKSKINLYGSYNNQYNKGRHELSITRNFYNDDKSLNAKADLGTMFSGKSNSHTARLGADYFISDKSTLGVVFSGFGYWGDVQPVTVSNIYTPDGLLESGLYSITDNTLRFRNYSGNINFKHQFDSTGKEWTFDLDYVRYNNLTDMQLSTSALDKWGSPIAAAILLKGHLPSHINIYSVKSDYVHPFGDNFKMEAGIKFSYVKNNNVVEYARNDGDGWMNDFRSNHFIYEESINATYVNLNKKLSDKWSVQAGVRAEHTYSKGNQVTTDSSFKKNYINLFPTAYVTYAMNAKNSLTLSYSRRVDRPNYQDMNPFIYFLDSLTYRKGNPFLLPQFSHNAELSHVFKGKFITTLQYSRTTDVIMQILKQNTETKTTFQTAENVSQYRNLGLSVNAPFKWTSWFNSNLFVNVFNNRYEGVYKNEPVAASYTAFMVNVTNNFTLAPGFSAELSGFYRSKGLDEMLMMNAMYQMTIGLQKTMMNGKSTLRLNIRDPFGWQKFGGYMKYGDVDISLKNRWDSRQVTASFTYRFGKSTVAPSRKRGSGISEELNRVGGQE